MCRWMPALCSFGGTWVDSISFTPVQVDRKVVPADWKQRLDVIQKKTTLESKELPTGLLGQFTGACSLSRRKK